MHISVCIGLASALHTLAISIELKLAVEGLITLILALPETAVQQAQRVLQLECKGAETLVEEGHALAVMMLVAGDDLCALREG